MTVNLDDYREDLIAAAPELAGTLDATFAEAARVMSPAALQEWLDGARGIVSLRKGPELLITWLDEMPLVAKECGEDIVGDVLEAAFKLSSMVSGQVLERMIATLPGVSRRLGDPDLLRAYLQLLHRLSARAPRGLRSLFRVIDELLGKLTLTGLRRWADFGADAYRRDLVRQAAYFGLETEDSRAVLEAERKGTLFIDSQRRLNFYLRAFWGRDFFLRPAAADSTAFRPFISDGALHLPDAVDAIGGVSGIDLFRAMAAHMAAHVSYTDMPQSAGTLAPAERYMIGLMEDARVEWCAARDFPGLRRLWLSLAEAAPAAGYEHEAMALLEATALALLDPARETGDALLDDLARRFHAHVGEHARDGAFAADLGRELYGIFSARRALPSLRILESLNLPWRDDNRFVWSLEEFEWAQSTAYIPASQRQVRKHVSLMEFVNEVEVETAGDDAQEIWVLGSELFPYEDEGISYNEMEGKEPVSAPFHYPEFDYRVQLDRPAWTTVYERRHGRADPEIIDRVLSENKGISHRIKQIIDRLRPQGMTRMRKLEDGDELDLNAAVDAMVMLRIGQQPDMRITMRSVINRRDLAVLVLLDLSESTNDPVRGTDKTVLDLTREATALVAAAIEGIGDPFAIHGFSSDGRHDVQYTRFKDFDQPLDEEAKSRLAGMKGGLSTRMGAAMRHAAYHLRMRPERHKLLLLVTDGEPADIDERDPQYLRMDTKKAVQELQKAAIHPYCLTLDPEADRYVARIFGENNFTIIDDIRRLPEKLPRLFAALTG